MLKSFLVHPVARFFLKATGLYILWYLLYELWIHPAGKFDLLIIDNLIFTSSVILKLLGYTLIDFPYSAAIRSMGIDGTHGLWIGDACNGITLFALFTGFMLAFPGPLKAKFWFIPLGLLFIHILNIFRIVGLSVTQFYFPDALDFNHTYTFTILVYSLVFALWLIWVNKFYMKKSI